MELPLLSVAPMTARRFVLPPEAFTGDSATLSGDLYRYAVTVLRLSTGSRVLLSDGHGREYSGTIAAIERASALITIDAECPATAAESGPRITLYQGLPKGDKIDLILQKCTELGATAIVPFMAERSVVRLTAAQAGQRLERWRRIVREASRQSQRSTVPDVFLAMDLDEALRPAGAHRVKLLLWEEEQATRLKDTLAALPLPETVAVLVGPEGGFSPAEVATARENGFIPITLGRRILRTETAGLAIMAILQFYWGDIG